MSGPDEIVGIGTLVLDGKVRSKVGYYLRLRDDRDPNQKPSVIEGAFDVMYDAVEASDVVLRLENGQEIELLATQCFEDKAMVWLKNPPADQR